LDAVAAGALDGVTKIFALHCDPRLEVGQVGVRVGAITSAADTVELRLDSPGGHTSRPHLTTDLVYALGTVITGLPGMLSRRIDPRTSTVMVWGAVVAGQAPNAIPQTGMLTGTVRTGDGAVCPAGALHRGACTGRHHGPALLHLHQPGELTGHGRGWRRCRQHPWCDRVSVLGFHG
jgi:hypothetical protein